jgi:hypothetical protein
MLDGKHLLGCDSSFPSGVAQDVAIQRVRLGLRTGPLATKYPVDQCLGAYFVDGTKPSKVGAIREVGKISRLLSKQWSLPNLPAESASRKS